MKANGAFKQRGREASRVNYNDPKLIRLPKQGVPSKENEFSPPVRSVSLGPEKDSKGWTRLIYFDSLMQFLDSKLEEGGK
jgi:hypothetical protein